MKSMNIPYQIVSCSSEDPQYPITAIQNASIRSSGWQTSQNPVYPVDFVIDLGTKVDLETLQFVSHQCKIANRITLAFGDTPTKFKNLGSFQFSDNSQTRFSARELKSVNLQRVITRFLRITIGGCYSNANNAYNQTGIVSLRITGKADPGSIGSAPSTSNSSRPNTAQIQTDIQQQIQTLQQDKADAIAREDFEKAARVKKEIDTLKKRQEMLIQLENAKKEAILSEDFVSAAKIKNQINAIISGNDISSDFSSNTNTFNSNPISNQNQNINQNQNFNRKSNPYTEQSSYNDQNDQGQNAEQIKQRNKQETKETKPEPISKPKKSSEIPNEEPHKPKPVKKSAPIEYPDEPDIPKLNGADLSEERPIHGISNPYPEEEGEGTSMEVDNLAGTLHSPMPMDISPEEEGDFGPPDELSGANRQESAQLITLFGEDPVARFFSKNLNIRVQGINLLCKGICDLVSGHIEAFFRFCYIVRHQMKENHRQVVISSLSAVRSIASAHQIEGSDLVKGIQQFMPGAAAKIGGTQAVSDAVCDFMTWASQVGALDYILTLINGDGKKNLTWKAALAKVNLLHEIVLTVGIDTAPGLSLDDVMNFVIPHLSSAKVEVRQAVIELIVTLEELEGSAIYKYFEKLNPRTRKEVEKAIETHKQLE